MRDPRGSWTLVSLLMITTVVSSGLMLAQPQAPAGQLRAPDVVYVPTPQEVVDAMLEVAQVKSTDVIYDLGSGDGRIPITAAQKYGARGVGRLRQHRLNPRSALADRLPEEPVPDQGSREPQPEVGGGLVSTPGQD